MLFFAILFEHTPTIVAGNESLEEVAEKAKTCYGAAGLYAATTIISILTYIWDKNQRVDRGVLLQDAQYEMSDMSSAYDLQDE
jgi:dihydroorotase